MISTDYSAPSCAPLLFYDLGQLTRCLISHTYRRFRHSFAALEKSLKILAKQIALGGKKLLRASATHHVIHFLEIAGPACDRWVGVLAQNFSESVTSGRLKGSHLFASVIHASRKRA
jgi:hypothetical protein